MRNATLLVTLLLIAGQAPAQFVGPGGVIPVVANLPGANETFWRSDVSILNVTNQDTQVVLQLYPEIVGGSPAFETDITDPITVAASSQVTLSNVVQSQFDLVSAKGALWVISLDGTPLVLASRTYTVAAGGGSYGQDVTSVLLAGPSWAGGLRHDGFFRTNLGVFWPWDLPVGESVQFTVTVRSAAGDAVGSGTLSFTEAGLQQVSLSTFGVATLLDGYAEISCSDPGAVYYAYASRVDQVTGDAVFRLARGYESALP